MRFFSVFLLAGYAIAADVPGKAFNRFITIWLENQDFTKVSANSDIDDLAKEGILLSQYFGLTHPSEPNYIASVGGDYFGLNNDNFVRIPENVSTVVDLFDTKGISWRGYFEAIPGPGYMGADSLGEGGHNYVRKHNPFISYDSINHNGSRLSNILSFADFQHDLNASSLPQYAHMSPDMQNDGHDTSLGFAATWSRNFLTPLLSNDYFMKDTLVLLTYDESETYSLPNKIVSVLLGGAVPANLKGTTDDTFYTHYSILSTLENNWGLPNLGRYDVGANVFKMVADKTGYQNRQVNTSKLDLSVSYSGYLNSGAYLPIPPPNIKLTGAGGQGVVGEVMNQWQSAAQDPTPYDGSGNVYDGQSPPVYGVQKANPLPSPVTTSIASAAATSAASATLTPSPSAKSVGEKSSILLPRIFFASLLATTVAPLCWASF